jgi:DNA-binding CsgD family transcriptional regulator
MYSKLHRVKEKLKQLTPNYKEDCNTGRPRKVEDNKLRELHSQGLNDKQIAKTMECAETTVSIRRRKLRLPINNPVVKRKYHPRHVVDNDAIRKIKRMNASGCSDVQIANELHLNYKTVQEWRRDNLRLPTNSNSKYGMFKIMQNDGLTNKQFAEVLGVKVSTVRCWRFRLKNKGSKTHS